MTEIVQGKAPEIDILSAEAMMAKYGQPQFVVTPNQREFNFNEKLRYMRDERRPDPPEYSSDNRVASLYAYYFKVQGWIPRLIGILYNHPIYPGRTKIAQNTIRDNIYSNLIPFDFEGSDPYNPFIDGPFFTHSFITLSSSDTDKVGPDSLPCYRVLFERRLTAGQQGKKGKNTLLGIAVTFDPLGRPYEGEESFRIDPLAQEAKNGKVYYDQHFLNNLHFNEGRLIKKTFKFIPVPDKKLTWNLNGPIDADYGRLSNIAQFSFESKEIDGKSVLIPKMWEPMGHFRPGF